MLKSKNIFLFASLTFLMLVLFLMDIGLGQVSIPLKEVFKSLTGQEASKETWQYIIVNFRLPKAITAILVGMGLSISGLLMQTMFRNPLAGPYVLGLSSGANSALWLAAKYPNQVLKAVINGANLTTSAETIGEYWNMHHKNILDSISNIQNKTEKDKIELKIIKREYNNMTLEDLHKIQAPSLIISGDYDTIKPSHSLQIFENIKKSYLYIQPSSGHLISWIYKDEFVKKIDHFFSTPYKQFTEKDKSDMNQ